MEVVWSKAEGLLVGGLIVQEGRIQDLCYTRHDNAFEIHKRGLATLNPDPR